MADFLYEEAEILREDHSRDWCDKDACKKCTRKHHELLHRDPQKSRNKPPQVLSGSVVESSSGKANSF